MKLKFSRMIFFFEISLLINNTNMGNNFLVLEEY